MSEAALGKKVFSELELQNPAVAQALSAFRSHYTVRQDQAQLEAHPTLPPQGARLSQDSSTATAPSYDLARVHRPGYSVSPIALALLLGGAIITAIVGGPVVVRFVAGNWRAILLPVGGICLGSGAVLLLRRVGESPLRHVHPPKGNSASPLRELEQLAERTAARLRSAYRLQLWAAIVVGTLFVALIGWSVIMVTKKQILYASAFGSGGLAMIILAQWKWQPFDRINQARRLADNADTLATGLRLRMKSILEIKDPAARSQAQWAAVKEYLDHS